jgi:hypothetical protein
MTISKGNVFYMSKYLAQKQSDRLYNFKAGDEVYHLDDTSIRGVVHCGIEGRFAVNWGPGVGITIYGSSERFRPVSLPEDAKPSDCGKLWHTNTVKG